MVVRMYSLGMEEIRFGCARVTVVEVSSASRLRHSRSAGGGKVKREIERAIELLAEARRLYMSCLSPVKRMEEALMLLRRATRKPRRKK